MSIRSIIGVLFTLHLLLAIQAFPASAAGVTFAPPQDNAALQEPETDRSDSPPVAVNESEALSAEDAPEENKADAESAQGGDEDKSDDADTEGDESEEDESEESSALVSNDAVIFGILLLMLAGIFWTYNSGWAFFTSFYKFVPMLLLCYFLPSLLTLFGVVDAEASNLYFVATRYLLPASLILLTLSIDLNEVRKLGSKALIMFGTGTAGVILGGPLAILIVRMFNPDLVGGTGEDETWRGLSTVAGSWIGGGANQTAMKGTYNPSEGLFSVMVAIDVLVAEVWMVFLLLGVGKHKAIDRWFKADASAVTELQEKMEAYSKKTARIPTTTELMVLAGLVFGAVGACHLVADYVAPWIEENAEFLTTINLENRFLWLILMATNFGLLFSFTPLRNLEGVGASKVGTIFIFILVAVIGMGMDVSAVYRYRGLFLVGLIWMSIHVGLMFFVAYIIRAPYFFLAVGSKANIGGAASAPVVAASFHPSLAPVGVLLAVLGYALGTYGAMICTEMMKLASP